MRRSERRSGKDRSGPEGAENPTFRRASDWRAWLVLAWVAWFGWLYGKMVVEQRGGRIPLWFAPRAEVPDR
jgi:hypothetical protein